MKAGWAPSPVLFAAVARGQSGGLNRFPGRTRGESLPSATLRLTAQLDQPEDPGRESDHQAGRAEQLRSQAVVQPVSRHAREKHRQSDRHDAGCPDHGLANMRAPVVPLAVFGDGCGRLVRETATFLIWVHAE